MLMQQLADYAIKEQTSKLPPEVIHHAKRAALRCCFCDSVLAAFARMGPLRIGA